MVYMGSKAKYANSIVPILQKMIEDNNIKTYVEPFCGGCSIIEHIKCDKKLAYDKSETLIALLKQIQEDIAKLPKDANRQMWDEGKAYVKDGTPLTTMTLAEVGAIEFFASFSNGGFPRGFAKNTETRNYYQEAYRNAEKQAPNLKDIEFNQSDYRNLPDFENCLIYCDSPYQGTKQYGYKKDNWSNTDFENYWNWVRKMSKKNIVVVSEQAAPDDFKCIWSCEAKRTCGKTNDYKAVEKLFVYNGEN